MQRISMYSEEGALKAFKLLATNTEVSITDKVCEAIDMMLAVQFGATDWRTDIDRILGRVQSQELPDLSGQQIAETVRASRQAKRFLHEASENQS